MCLRNGPARGPLAVAMFLSDARQPSSLPMPTVRWQYANSPPGDLTWWDRNLTKGDTKG